MIWVSESSVTAIIMSPNTTSAVPVKPVPVMVTLVPPASGPVFGDTDVIVSGGLTVMTRGVTDVASTW